jgi:hypothetical protein
MNTEQIENESAEANAIGTAIMQERERTARRCAEIADRVASDAKIPGGSPMWLACGDAVAKAIRREFGMEPQP